MGWSGGPTTSGDDQGGLRGDARREPLRARSSMTWRRADELRLGPSRRAAPAPLGLQAVALHASLQAGAEVAPFPDRGVGVSGLRDRLAVGRLGSSPRRPRGHPPAQALRGLDRHGRPAGGAPGIVGNPRSGGGAWRSPPRGEASNASFRRGSGDIGQPPLGEDPDPRCVSGICAGRPGAACQSWPGRRRGGPGRGGGRPVVERGEKTSTVRSTTSSRAQRIMNARGAARRPTMTRSASGQAPADAPSRPGRPMAAIARIAGSGNERSISSGSVQKKPTRTPPGPAGGAVLEQDLEALHRVARPGVVARDDQVGRRPRRGPRNRRRASAASRSCTAFGMPRGAPRRPAPAAPSRWLIETHGPEPRRRRRGSPAASGCPPASPPSSRPGVAAGPAPGGAAPPASMRWLVPGKISL